MTGLVFGEGNLMGSRGQTHKRLRNEFNTAFTAAAVRGYLPVFQKVAQAITEELETSEGPSINIVPLLSTAALKSIAEAALSYSMDDLGAEYVAANVQIMAAASNQSAGQILGDAVAVHLPVWLLRAATRLPTEVFKVVRNANYLANRLGRQVIREKNDSAQRGVDINGDVFGILLDPERSDTARNALTEEEIVTQTAIIMIAGQETTASTLAFGLVELAKNPKLQEMLRAEIHSFLGTTGEENVAYDRMPLLNAFIKESLRFYPAEPITERMALQDTVIPLSQSITTATGEIISQIPVRNGQIVLVRVASYQRLESRWGEDAHEFRPSRWLEGTVSKGEAVGPYANLLTFLGGPHTCLGWRFAILEMQVVICELVGKFSFILPDNDPVRVRLANTLQPTMSNGQKGALLWATRVL